jgi:choice-of-anchor C domain-containing protein
LNKRRSILGITGALLASVAIAGSAFAAGPVFQNGSFEDGTFTQFASGVDFDRVAAGSPDLTGWTVTGGGVDWIGTYWSASQGSRSLDLDGAETAAPGGVSQTIPTSVNSTYVVTFDMSGNPDDAANQPAVKQMTVAATGTPPQTFTYDISANHNTRADMKWAPLSYTFVANSASTVLSFTSATPGGYGPALDNISVTETLLTGANCKNSGWKTMFDKTGTPFRNQGDCVSYYATGEKNLAY